MATDTHVAVIFDFDDTLMPDTTSQLLETYGIESEKFWEEKHRPLLREGYGSANAYMELIRDRIGPSEPFGELTTNDLRDFGGTLDGNEYPGIPEIFDELQTIVDDQRDATVDFYIISGGLYNVIKGTSIADHFSGIYASEFGHGGNDHITHVKRAVNFTEKTRYLFEINKGLSPSETRENPFIVNQPMDEEERRVPWENMIYVGDGMTDVPCFSLVSKQGGHPIGILHHHEKSSRQKALDLIDAPERVKQTHLPRYGDEDELGIMLRARVESICSDKRLGQQEAL